MRPKPLFPIVAILVSTCLSFSAGVGLAQELSKEVLDAAKREGRVTVYGSPETEIMKAIETAFEQKYGVKVDYWRASSTKVLDRALTESRAGKPLFDVVLTNETPMRILKKEGVFGKFIPPAGARYAESVKDPDGVLSPPYRQVVVGILYNPRLIKAEDLPRSLKDLLNPKWKGKIVMSDPTRHSTMTTWLANLEKLLGKETKSFLEGLAAQKPLMVESFIPAAQKIIAGEAPIGVSYIKYVYLYGKKEGAPLDYVRLKQALAEYHYVAVGAQPPHPNAARLFANYFITEDALKILASQGEFVLLKGVYPPIPDADKLEIVQMDDLSDDELKKARADYKKLFF